MVHRKLLRLSATLVLIGGVLVTVIVQFLHPGGGSTLEATFSKMIWLYIIAWLGKESAQAAPA